MCPVWFKYSEEKVNIHLDHRICIFRPLNVSCVYIYLLLTANIY